VEGPSGAGDAPSPPAGGQVGGYADLAALPPKTLAEADAFVESMGYDLDAFYERPTEEDFESLSTNGLADKELAYTGYDLFGQDIGDANDQVDEDLNLDYDYKVIVKLDWAQRDGKMRKSVNVFIIAGYPLHQFNVMRSTNASDNWPMFARDINDKNPNLYVGELPTYKFVHDMPELRTWIWTLSQD
jgi:hypothetical protein